MIEFSNVLYSNLFLKAPTLPRAVGWETMPCMLIIENLFKHVHEWMVGNMSYTLDSYYTFNWYHGIFSIGITIDILFVYSYMLLYMYAHTSNSINFDWYSFFHTYICILFVLTISLYL